MAEPYYEDSHVKIFHGDCREILPSIPNKSIDLVLTDPPYGFNRFATDGQDFIKVISEVFGMLPLKDGGWAFVFSGTGALADLFNAIPLDFQRLLWVYKL